MLLEWLFISLGKRLCFIFLPSFQWQNGSWQRNRRERQCRNLNHLLNHHFHSSFFSANIEIRNEGGIQLPQHILPKRQKQQAQRSCRQGVWAAQLLSPDTAQGRRGAAPAPTPPLGLGLLWGSKPWGGGRRRQLLLVLTGSLSWARALPAPSTTALRGRRRHEPKQGRGVQTAR